MSGTAQIPSEGPLYSRSVETKLQEWVYLEPSARKIFVQRGIRTHVHSRKHIWMEVIEIVVDTVGGKN